MPRILPILFLFALAWPNDGSHPWRETPFSKDRLTRESSLQLQNPAGFSMQQSYSLSYTGGSWGSASSGLYLNTLSYNFSIPLTLSVDIGMYNLLHASYAQSNHSSHQLQDSRPEILIPRIGLEYQPTDNTTLSLQIINTSHALKAYGTSGLLFWDQPRWRRR